ncbi:hypothetical protein ACQ858_13295 [Variovorax ureilyticus]|uniref:hypothetical protein n=1 Tax=Variovorax ureilyticus TaxID=1836198 RepID=UPI003D676574
MTTISSTGLQPIIRDRAGTVEPVPAAIAAMTGQPLTEVVRVLRQCIADLKALAGVRAEVAVQDACHAALHRFGYNGHRLFADYRRHRALGELLTAYSNAPGESELLLALCEDGEALAFFGQQVSSRVRSAPQSVNAAVLAGELNPGRMVRFALTFTTSRPAQIASPDHRFLETIAIPAFALADAYGIEITPIGWPYWNLTFPEALIDGSPGNGEQVVCGEHELLEAVSGRVHLERLACELTDQILVRQRHR